MVTLKKKVNSFPQKPGVYQFLNKNAEVIYIGKAKNLRARVRQYFGHDDNRRQIPFLMAEAVDITYTVVTNELESAYLENTLIKQYHPKYNIDLQDDKNYAFITIDYSTEIPQIGYARKIEPPISYKPRLQSPKAQADGGQVKPKSLFFGPYSAAYKIRNTLNLVRKIFPFCSAKKISHRPCFYYYMHRCPGVCVGKISIEEYKKHLDKIAKFLQGDISGITKEIKSDMAKNAKAKKFETAARLRDQLKTLTMLEEKQSVILPKKVDWDIVSTATADGFTCVNLFKIRGGKLFDKENFVYELPITNLRMEDKSTNVYESEILSGFLNRYYLETSSQPKEIFIQDAVEDQAELAKIISARFGKKIKLSIPQKGKIFGLITLGSTNAQEYLKNWLADKAGHLDKINLALTQLKEILNLKEIPKRIECYDISNTQGTNPVGSMVVFKDGLPAKSEYRKFKIYGKNTPDDFAMMKEMLTRRMSRSIKDKGLTIKDKAHWPIPDLIVIDGGKGQLNIAYAVLKAKNYQLQALPIIGLAKRIEEIFLPHQDAPIILKHDQPALQLLQRLRDEAHRFGITFHRQLRSKQAVKSALDDIPGIGPKTKKLLKTKFGTVAEIKKAGLDELTSVVGKKLAETIIQNL